MSERLKLGLVILALAVAGGSAYWYRHRGPGEPIRRADQGEPQKTAEQILQERANQASGHLLTPIGKAFTAKNWVEFKSLYQPQSQFHDLAEIIRAMYIQNQFSTYTNDDMDQVIQLVYDTLERIEPKNRAHAGLLITQFYRMPLPQKQSATYRQIESWLDQNTKDGVFLRRLAITKLALQDTKPPATAVKLFIAGYLGTPDGTSLVEWIRMTDDIRSPAVREHCLKELFKAYPHFNTDEKAQALIVFGHEPLVNALAVSKLAIESLHSGEQATFEAGLRAVGGLLSANVLSAEQKSSAVKILSKIPEKMRTPFVSAKVADLLPKLSSTR